MEKVILSGAARIGVMRELKNNCLSLSLPTPSDGEQALWLNVFVDEHLAKKIKRMKLEKGSLISYVADFTSVSDTNGSVKAKLIDIGFAKGVTPMLAIIESSYITREVSPTSRGESLFTSTVVNTTDFIEGKYQNVETWLTLLFSGNLKDDVTAMKLAKGSFVSLVGRVEVTSYTPDNSDEKRYRTAMFVRDINVVKKDTDGKEGSLNVEAELRRMGFIEDGDAS